MQISSGTVKAMLHCPYKAWKLLKEEHNEDVIFIPNEEFSKRENIALLALDEMIKKNKSPAFYKNAHCTACQFWKSCQQKLQEKDCISLLGGMPATTISKYHSKGIFTILQLSHLFRLRRKRNHPHTAGSYLYELKALAIREKKTYVLQQPDFDKSTVEIYLDFEGLPEENFIYLIGVVVNNQCYSFWANDKENEAKIFSQLFDLLEQYPEAPIFHYGSYELKVLRKFKERFSLIEKRMINLLSFFRSHVYPPTYTNGLKEIAGFLGFQWQQEEANGLKSIEWRKNWEHTAGEKWKDKLVQYNLDDCNALARVHKWLLHLSDDGDVQQVAKMKKHTPYKLQNNPEYGEDFHFISKAAYFDYQRTKIYWRTEKKVSTVKPKNELPKPGRGGLVWQPKHVNEIIQMPRAKRCPKCNHKKIYQLASFRKFRITDLKFTSKGIKQWVIEYHSGKGKCAGCRHNFNDSVLRQTRYGNNLLAWSINLYVNYKVSFAMITRLLQEQFGILTSYTYFNERNYHWWQRFKPEVDYCWQIIRNSPFINIDETTVRLAKGKERGYVWAFATPHTVFYHLTLTRESAFLQEWLKDYKGVIVSDFFAGYESLPVTQQKCLVHLIRDLNDDLFKNPFDDEYKKLVNEFSQLLKKIVMTIDRYGLKKLNLNKHKKDTNRFYKDFIESEPQSELTKRYVKRLKKQWDQLWTFLSFDGLPWNNNNAEAAVKAFAVHRRNVNGQVSEGGLKEYLSMLTISQTCRYRNISFLDFVRGKAGIWQNIHSDLLPGFLPYNQAKLFIQKQKLPNKKEWQQWKVNDKRPRFIPDDPETIYENKGWKNFDDWLNF